MKYLSSVLITKAPGAQLPTKRSEGASGWDLHALLKEPITLESMSRFLIPSGISIAILTEGYEAQIRPRSGLALHHGITCLNTPGTIDSDYRGEIKVLLINLSSQPYTINTGDRIAQLVFSPIALTTPSTFTIVDRLPDTQRGQNGFGSTGDK